MKKILVSSFILLLISFTSCEKVNQTNGSLPAQRFVGIYELSGHGLSFSFEYDSNNHLSAFRRRFDEDYGVFLEVICDNQGYVQTLISKRHDQNGIQLVDSFPVLYDGQNVESFEFLNSYNNLERFEFSYDNQNRMIQVQHFPPTTASYYSYEFTYDQNNNVIRTDRYVKYQGTIQNHYYVEYTYDNKPNPFTLMEDKYKPFLCGLNDSYPLSENNVISQTFYNVTGNVGVGSISSFSYTYRQDNLPSSFSDDSWFTYILNYE